MAQMFCANGRKLKCEGSCREHNLRRADRKFLTLCPSAYYPVSIENRMSKPTVRLKTRRVKSASGDLSIESRNHNKWRE